MLDIKVIREQPDLVKAAAKKKNQECDIDGILDLDSRRREIIREVEELKSRKNKASGEIAQKKKAGESADDAIAAMRALGEDIARLDDDRREVEQKLHDLLIWVPNIPHESVPVGTDESANKVVREWGKPRKADFAFKPHWDIAEALGILDLTAATRVSGAGFYLLKGAGARLQRALVNYMLNLHIADGYTEVAVPHLVTYDTMFGTGQLPKMAADMYELDEGSNYLIPTAEVPVTNMYRGEIIGHDMLPMRMVAHTPCYRREAGAAGKDTRGMLRVHQFDKVELVKIVPPDDSYAELEDLTEQAEKVIKSLELPYRLALLASGDLSFASAKTYDIELWAPGVQKYLEVSSISTFEDFQARRMNCRFRDADKTVKFPHTLNGSGVALPRLMAAIIEHYQNADGTVSVPKPLQPYMDGLEVIG